MKMRRYKKLDSEVISLGDGENPLSTRINPDYKQEPGNSRKCIECGKTHDTIIENMRTGRRIAELDKCKDCFMPGAFVSKKNKEIDYKVALGKHDFPISNISTQYGGNLRCKTSDGRTVNMAEELNRLEKECINGLD